jgi:hypothetical protein
MLPSVGLIRWLQSLRIVLLPLPDGPIIEIKSLVKTPNETPSIIVLSPPLKLTFLN